MKAPPENFRVRATSKGWVDVLKERIANAPYHHTTVLPCAVLGDITKETFDKEKLDEYDIVTLGGNHLREATTSLLEENENLTTQLSPIEVDLYLGLTAEEARRLANLDNLQSETFRLCFLDK